MHGLIFSELKKFVVARLGADAWNKLLEESGLAAKRYLPTQTYNDEELGRLVATASRLSGIPAPKLMESFGEFIAPELLRLYSAQINPAWRTLDVLEKTESFVHRAVRLKVPGADPPRLATTRPRPDEVILEYTSTRRLCPVAIGIIKGTAQSLKDQVEVREDQCMLRGDARCLITTRVVAAR